MDFYAVLGVAPNADDAAIRRAYRVLARRFHPDAGEGSSTERFRAVVEAYETLSDPARRLAYDRSRRRPSAHVPVEPISNVRVYRVPVRQPRRPAVPEPFSDWEDPFGRFDRLFDGLLEEFFGNRPFLAREWSGMPPQRWPGRSRRSK